MDTYSYLSIRFCLESKHRFLMPRPLRITLRREILEMAAVEFSRQGYRPVRLDDIARSLGVTKGAVYFHFRNKLDVFLAAIERLEELRDASQGEAPPDPVDRLRMLLAARLRFHARYPELRRLQWLVDTELQDEPAAAARDGIRAEYRDLRAQLRGLLQQAARCGALDVHDPAAEAFRLASNLEGTLVQHAAAPEDIGPFLDVERLVDRWLEPLVRKARRRRAQEPEPKEAGEDFQPAF